MRHGKKFNHLGRTASHRKAMLSNMASSLIINKRITTTVAKAKALRKYVEPLITKSKVDSTQSRRVVFSYLQDKVSSQVLFSEVAEKVADRPGGYTRIIKLGSRLGDNAEMALIELVDFNELYTQGEEATKTRTRRSRRGKKKGASTQDTTQAAPATAVAADTPVEDAAVADTTTSEEAAPVDTAAVDTATETTETAPEEAVTEVKDEGDVVTLSGEAVVGDPVTIEDVDAEEEPSADTTEEEPKPNAAPDEDTDEPKDKP